MTKDKREIKKRIAAFFSVSLCLLLMGCQTGTAAFREQSKVVEAEEGPEESDMMTDRQTAQTLSGIDRPTVSSNIAIDLQGYAPEDLKYAYFSGQDLKDEFCVYRQKDKQIVYRGTIQPAGETGSARGDFSQLTEPGSYYIQTAVIGRSYTFQIEEDRYRKQYETDLYSWQKTAPEAYYKADAATNYRALFILALLQEFYGGQEENTEKLQEDADYLMQTYAEHTGSVSSSDPETDCDTIYAYAAAMAQSYQVLNKETGAQAYLRQAQTAYQEAIRRTDQAQSARYMAASALYKATGSYSYHQVVRQYADAAEDTMEGFWGDMLYLTSLQRVDTTLCEQQMNSLLKECGELSDRILSQQETEEKENCLEAMIKLAVADDTLVSLEYRNACKTLLHMLGSSDRDEMDCGQRSALLFIEGELAESEVKK